MSYDPADVRAVMDANRPKLLAIAEAVAAVTSSLAPSTPQGKSDKPATEPRKAA